LHPIDWSWTAIQETMGVFPVPPTVMLPTLTTGTETERTAAGRS